MPKPTAKEPKAKELLHSLRCDCDHVRLSCEEIGCYAGPLASRVEKVLALHGQPSRRGIQRCRACNHGWPCPTRRILDGAREQARVSENNLIIGRTTEANLHSVIRRRDAEIERLKADVERKARRTSRYAAEVDEARRDRDEENIKRIGAQGEVDEAWAEQAALRAEGERLREGLLGLVNALDDPYNIPVQPALDVARAALRGTKP